jgi:nitrate reductase delta subunit
MSNSPEPAIDRLADLTRRRFDLAPGAWVTVVEIPCDRPGFPPVETLVSFWTDSDTGHHFKLFKPAEAVVEDDLPPRWMRDSLIAHPIFGCSCCS